MNYEHMFKATKHESQTKHVRLVGEIVVELRRMGLNRLEVRRILGLPIQGFNESLLDEYFDMES